MNKTMLYESDYYGICDLGAAISHHGIKGQQWGVRNGPPYPLEDKNRYGSTKKKKQKKNQPSLLDRVSFVMKILSQESSANRWQKKVNKEFSERIKHNNTNIQKKIEGEHSEDDDQRSINRGWYSGKKEYAMNCMMCTTAYELRRRGYDVQANSTALGRPETSIGKYFKRGKIGKTKSYDALSKTLNEMPEGSRGNVMAGCGPFDSPHSMAWEKKDGKIVIRDCQSNRKYDSIDASIINKKSRVGYSLVRTDNLEINWQNIRDAVIERKDE